jgi:hypothetical protein
MPTAVETLRASVMLPESATLRASVTRWEEAKIEA